MPLSTTDNSWEHGSYEADRDLLIKISENEALFESKDEQNPTKLDAHSEGKSIAMGYGYDLIKNVNNLVTDLQNLVTSSQQGTSVAASLSQVQTLIQQYNAATNKTLAMREQLAIDINDIITLGTEANAVTLLNQTIEKFETALSNKLGTLHDLSQSRERAAVISQIYRLGASGAPSLLEAIENDNRAEAWFEIRYRSNADELDGNYTRVVTESNMFGLYGGGDDTLDDNQAKTVMRMYTKNRAKIELEEGKKPTAYSGNNSILSQIAASKNKLIESFGQGVEIDGEMIVGAGLDSYNYKNEDIADDLTGTDNNDLMFGERGNDTLNGGLGRDVLLGGEGNDNLQGNDGNDHLDGGNDADTLDGGTGNDTLIGGIGNDTLIGGTGFDTYIINQGDGNDTIIEEREADGRILGVIKDSNGNIIGTGAWEEIGDGLYENVETGEQATRNSPLTLQHGGGQITLENFQNGDFGITLLDSTNPAQMIVGPGDDDANYLLDHNDPLDQGREIQGGGGRDMVSGAIGDDFLYGGDGDDWINGVGGADRIEGGAGNDLISWIGGGSMVKGGDGDDIITANARFQVAVDIPSSQITHDVIWADMSQHWQTWHADTFAIDGNGYIAVNYSDGFPANGSFSGTSKKGGNWTYEYTVTNSVLEMKYFHPTEAPGGMVPAWDIRHGMGQEPMSDKGVVLLGEGGNDVLIGHNQSDYLSGGTQKDMLTGNGGNDILDGGAGDDSLAGGEGSDTLLGGEGSDQHFGESGSDAVLGGNVSGTAKKLYTGFNFVSCFLMVA